MSSSLSSQNHKERRYFCDCHLYCKHKKQVSKTTYYAHQKLLRDAAISRRDNRKITTTSTAAEQPDLAESYQEDNAEVVRATEDISDQEMEIGFEGTRSVIQSGSHSPSVHSQSHRSLYHHSQPSSQSYSRSPSPSRSPTPDPGSDVFDNLCGSHGQGKDIPDNDVDEESESASLSNLIDIRLTQEYIQHLQNATLQNGDLTESDVESENARPKHKV